MMHSVQHLMLLGTFKKDYFHRISPFLLNVELKIEEKYVWLAVVRVKRYTVHISLEQNSLSTWLMIVAVQTARLPALMLRSYVYEDCRFEGFSQQITTDSPISPEILHFYGNWTRWVWKNKSERQPRRRQWIWNRQSWEISASDWW